MGECEACLHTSAFARALIGKLVDLSYVTHDTYKCLMVRVINTLMQHAPSEGGDWSEKQIEREHRVH